VNTTYTHTEAKTASPIHRRRGESAKHKTERAMVENTGFVDLGGHEIRMRLLVDMWYVI
jgi:hypothetical protein